MKLVLENGIDVECSVDEFVELQNKGFLNKEKSESEYTFLESKPTAQDFVKSRIHKRFRKFEDKIMLDMWNKRKNKMKLNSKEYDELLRLMPGRSRSSICNRMFKLRHDLP